MDRVWVSIGTSPTNCPDESGFDVNIWEIPLSPTGQFSPWVYPMKEFTVAAGTHTYYINGYVSLTGGNVSFYWAGIEATFIPD